MEVYILKTNLTKQGKGSEIIGVYDSIDLALSEKEKLVEDFKEIVGNSETISETTSEDSAVTFIYPKSLDGPVYWYSISKRILNNKPETWIVMSEASKTIGVFSSKEKAFESVKKYCKDFYDVEISDEALLSCYVFVYINDNIEGSNKKLHVDTFKIKKLDLNKLCTNWSF